jgi:hypothetical protein
MSLAAQIDELERRAWDLPKPVAIILVIFGFMVWWPLGLAALAFFIWSRGMGCGHRGVDRWQHKMDRMQAKMDRVRERMGAGMGGGGFWQPPSSGNRAFDEYRTETLKRLEDEQREFQDFLQRLRFAKDKSEFDQFMNERRTGGTPPSGNNQPPAQS